jgi:hypothetical protein
MAGIIPHALIFCDWSRAASPEMKIGLLTFFTLAVQNGHSVLISPKGSAVPEGERSPVMVQLAGDETPEVLNGWAALLGFDGDYQAATSSPALPALT